mgnify:CR=1 FL=1
MEDMESDDELIKESKKLCAEYELASIPDLLY